MTPTQRLLEPLPVSTFRWWVTWRRGSEHVGEIKEMDNLGTDARGRGKVDFAQVVKVAKS